jgi:hypothetical protein
VRCFNRFLLLLVDWVVFLWGRSLSTDAYQQMMAQKLDRMFADYLLREGLTTFLSVSLLCLRIRSFFFGRLFLQAFTTARQLSSSTAKSLH